MKDAGVLWAVANATGRALAGRGAGAWQAHDGPQGAAVIGAAALARGVCDAAALRLRFSNRRLAAADRAAGGEAARLHDALEQVRVETLGCRRFPGCGRNLAALQAAPAPARAASPLAARAAELLRERVAGVARPADPDAPGLEGTRAAAHLDALAVVVDDQAAFAQRVHSLIEALGLAGAAAPEEWVDPTEADAAHDALAAPGATASDRESDAPTAEVQAASPLPASSAGGGTPASVRGTLSGDAVLSTYRVYTADFDEEVAAVRLCSPAELAGLRQQLDAAFLRVQGTLPRLARRLQRHVQARQQWWWNFDQEEGILDGARLARTVANPLHTLSFKQERPGPFRNTVVTLLIDNSGSMRGEPIALAAASAELLARALERCGVKVEILGFTTRSWRGGAARRRWIADGQPRCPGRVAELRHVIYKAADVPWRRARLDVAALLREDLLKENIDGEALLWAHRRLLARPEERRVLVVISDGAPAEDATTSANPRDYLDAHLRAVTRWIDALGQIELLAIGIGYDVRGYYRRCVNIASASELGNALLGELTDLFDSPSRPPRTLPRAAAARLQSPQSTSPA